MSSRSRRDGRGPGRGGRHRARTPARTSSQPGSPVADFSLRRRAHALLAVPAALPAQGRAAPPALVPGRPCRGARAFARRPAAAPAPADGPPGKPLPRPVAIAAARAAVHRSRNAVPHAAVAAASWQRGLRREAVEPRPADRTRAATADAGAGGVRTAARPGEPPPEPRTALPDSRPAVPTGIARATFGARLRTAVLERLPLWVQLRCAVEPKTLAALAVVLLVAVGFAAHHFLDGRPEAVPAPKAASVAAPLAAPPDAAGAPSAEPGAGRLVVDVAGEVQDPGVHRLPRGSRVADALEAAGGVRPGTDEEELGGLNQARRLVDGEQIVVGAAGAVAGQPVAGAASAGPGGAATTRISLSSATAEQLETLPGVGPVLAGHIIDYRAAHGGFTSVDQLREVDGIGEARFADIEPEVGP